MQSNIIPSIYSYFIWIVFNVLFAYVEVAILKKSFRLAEIWGPMIPFSFYNIAFTFLLRGVFDGSYLFVLFVIPVIPAIYLGGKALMLVYISHPGMGMTKYLVLVIIAHLVTIRALLMPALTLEPNFENMKRAIDGGKNFKLKIMLVLGGQYVESYDNLVNRAIQNDNRAAIISLFDHNANPNHDYWLREFKDFESQMWLLNLIIDRGGNLDHSLSEYVPYLDEERLVLAIKNGYNPVNHPYYVDELFSEYQIKNQTPESILKKLQIFIDNGAPVKDLLIEVSPAFKIIRSDGKLDDLLIYLIQKGVDVNVKNYSVFYFSNGETVPEDTALLSFASMLNKPGYVKILLDNGADKSMKNAEGKTAYDYAPTDEISQLLK